MPGTAAGSLVHSIITVHAIMSEQTPSSLNAEKILAGVKIPPRPELLSSIQHEFEKMDPSLNVVSDLIARDVSLTAVVLKVVNSPFFGLSRKVTSAPFAVQMLGLKNIKCLVTGILLKQSVPVDDQSVEQFWISAERVAKMSAHIAGMLPRVPRDYAYTFGLFREIGIPLMLQRFPDYKQTLQRAFNEKVQLTELENASYSTNHAIVGRMVARTWLLPEDIYDGIQYHHDLELARTGEGLSPLMHTLIMINHLAEHLVEGEVRLRDYDHWFLIADDVMNNLGLNDADLDELRMILADEIE